MEHKYQQPPQSPPTAKPSSTLGYGAREGAPSPSAPGLGSKKRKQNPYQLMKRDAGRRLAILLQVLSKRGEMRYPRRDLS
jgi:hypothetical protein